MHHMQNAKRRTKSFAQSAREILTALGVKLHARKPATLHCRRNLLKRGARKHPDLLARSWKRGNYRRHLRHRDLPMALSEHKADRISPRIRSEQSVRRRSVRADLHPDAHWPTRAP